MELIRIGVAGTEIEIRHPSEYFPADCMKGDHRCWSREDGFFRQDALTKLWNCLAEQGRFRAAEEVYTKAVEVSDAWEQEQKRSKRWDSEVRIFKGTPYYLRGVARICGGDLEKGFLLIHQAYQEDKARHAPNVPIGTNSHIFITLGYDKDHPQVSERVREVKGFIAERLAKYRDTRCGSLEWDRFQTRFLESGGAEVLVFSFVFSAFRLRPWFIEDERILTYSAFASLLQVSTLFGFCLVLDKFIGSKPEDGSGQVKPRDSCKKKHPTLVDQLVFLSERANLRLHVTTCVNKQCRTEASLASSAFGDNPGDTLQGLLSSKYRFRHDTTIDPTPIEQDLLIALGLRNVSAHRIEEQEIVYNNFTEISQRILNALFFAVETLYGGK